VPDRVWVVRTGGFKNLLEVVFGWYGALLEITLGSCYKLLVGVLNFLPGVAIVRCHGETTQVAVLPLLPALGALLGASDGDTGECGSATAPTSSKVKAALTASLLEACWVVMLSNSLVVIGCSWWSS
jgi:hypothetical protein